MKPMLFTNQLPWYMAKARKQFVEIVTLPMKISTEFWNTWSKVKTPTDK